MSKKQKAMLTRILAGAALFVLAMLIPAEGWLKLVLFLIPYLVVGHKVLWKAAVNIAHGQVFDENFLMCVATIGAFVSGAQACQKNNSGTEKTCGHPSPCV